MSRTSYLNADAGYEDADGFAAKLTIGEGNVFDGCIAAYNADDGWDLFAKIETGAIGQVVIQNCVAFKNGYVLDGFPRTIPQAEVLDKALTELGDAIDFAIDVNVPDENIVKRMSGRRACLSCGTTYHIEHIPPKKEGICDKCGQELVLRDDDKPETVSKRLKVYHEQTQPLIDYYTEQGVLKTVDGTRSLDEVFQAIVEILGE